MSVRCLPNTPDNNKFIQEKLKVFKDESFVTMKSLVNSWMSNNLSDNEDRFPSNTELFNWRAKIRNYSKERIDEDRNNLKQYLEGQEESKIEESVLSQINDPKVKSFAKLVLDTANSLGIKFKKQIFNRDSLSEVSGKFVADEKTIYYNPKALQANTILHEAIHSITTYYFEISNRESLPKNIKIALKEIEYCYNALKQDYIETHFYENGKLAKGINVEAAFSFWTIGNDTYGYSNPKEMIAEITKPSFLEHIKDFDRRHKKENIFNKLINAIFKLFNINKEYKSLEGTIKKALVELVNNPSQEILDRYSLERKTLKTNLNSLKESHYVSYDKYIFKTFENKLEEADDSIDTIDVDIKITKEEVLNYDISFPEDSIIENHIPLNTMIKNSIFIYSEGLYGFFKGPLSIKDNKVNIPITLVSQKWLETHTFDVKHGSNGIDYIDNIKELEPIKVDNSEIATSSNNIQEITYTPKGKQTQTYHIIGTHIYNKENKEVFKGESIHRNKIFANLAVSQGRAVVVNYRDKDYVVNNKGRIVSVATGHYIYDEETSENNGNRKAIIELADKKFKANKGNITTVKWSRYSDNNYEVSSRGDSRFSAFNAKFKEGTIIDGENVSGKSIEWVYQNIIKKSGKGKAPAENSILHRNYWYQYFDESEDLRKGSHLLFEDYGIPLDLSQRMMSDYSTKSKGSAALTKEDLENISYYIGYLPLWKEWAKQNPDLIEELREKSKGKTLTDMFAKTRVSQARALAEILNSSNNTRNNINDNKDSSIIPSSRPSNESSPNTTLTPKDYTLNSGGARGSDNYWGEIANSYGINNVRHWEHKNRHSPYGNIQITDEDALEGAEEAAKAANRMYGYQWHTMNDENIIRDWAQAKYSDAIFAVGKLLPRGSKWNLDPNDNRVILVDTIVGGTGYAVNEAILNNKPVYIFNQEDNGTFPKGWYTYDANTNTYISIGTPILTKNFAGIGTRELNDSGRQAIKDVFDNTFKDYSNIEVKDTKTEETKTVENNLKKISQEFNPITRRNRVNKITRMFSNYVTKEFENQKKDLVYRIEHNDGNYDKQKELISELKHLNRFEVIRNLTPDKIFRAIKGDFEYLANLTPEVSEQLAFEDINGNPANNIFPEALKHKMAKKLSEKRLKAYKAVIDNWQELVEESISNFAFTEGVSMDINDNYIEKEADSDKNEVTDLGTNTNRDIEDKESETPYKDGWMINVREVSSYSSLSNKVRRIINNIARVVRGIQETDELGDTQFLEPSYVHSVLIQSLRNMTDATEMLPTLYRLAYKLDSEGNPIIEDNQRVPGRLPWIGQIIDAMEEDPRVFTSFYRAYRKDYLNYWIQKVKQQSDGSYKIETIPINRSEGTANYFDEWRDNYEYGNILDDDSLYNKDGEIDTSKAKVGLEIINDMLSETTRMDRKEVIDVTNRKDTINNLQKVLKMLGISVDNETLITSLNYQIEDDRFPVNLITMLDNLRTIYYDINKGNEKITDGKPADLINIYGTSFNNIAEIINNVDEDSVESNVRQGDKTRYAHVNPSHLTTLIKKLKGANYQKTIDEYKEVDWFYDKKTGWRNELLKDLEESQEVRDNLTHMVMLEFNRKEYNKWTELESTLVLFNQYNSSPTTNEVGTAYYQIPMLSDSQSAEFIKYKKYVDDYENIILDKLINLVKQEIYRIDLVKKRFKNAANVDQIANFDIVEDEKGIHWNGAEFKFMPELNTRKYGKNKSFLETLDSLETESKKEEFIRRELKSIMNDRFNSAKSRWKAIGIYDKTDSGNKYKYFDKTKEENVDEALREWYYNSTYAQSQIIQLLTTDLAYYKDLEDFQKRNKQSHAPAERLNTLATWNVNGKEEPVLRKDKITGKPRKERTIYLKDFKAPSLSLKDITELINNVSWLNATEKSVIIKAYKEINVADAQAYRSLDSFRATQIMADMWSDEEEEAYNNFKNNTWHARDFIVLWNTRKPYLYTMTNQSNQIDDGLLRVPTQNKNSELLLLTNAIFGTIFSSSPKLKAINQIMKDFTIDVVQFESTVKDGKQGVININDLEDYSSIYNKLSEECNKPNHIHEFDYNDYGIQTATPEHAIDVVTLVGTQIRRLIGADANALNDPNFRFEYNNKKWTVDEWFNYFNAINVANIKEAFEYVDSKFKDNKAISELLLSEIRSNPRYGKDIENAVKLDANGNFNIPLSDPSQTLRIQSLLNSVLKSRVTKQKIKGAALIQASCYGLSKEPKIVFEGEGKDKHVAYVECYLPCPTEELYNALLTKGTHELDINKKDKNGNYIVPRKYLEAIGYRVPTEDKYSMLPLKVIGFLPRQVGSVVILPRDITTIAGSDFDVDKLYVMYHSLQKKINFRDAWSDFYKENPEINDKLNDARWYSFNTLLDKARKENPKLNLTFEQIQTLFKNYRDTTKKYEFIDGVKDIFNQWLSENINRYSYFETISYNYGKDINPNDKMSVYNNAKAQTKEQRDSLMIDLMFSVLTNSDTAGRFLNPGGFEEPKRVAKINIILDNLVNNSEDSSAIDACIKEFGSIDNLLKSDSDTIKTISDKMKVPYNPIVPDTWVKLHQLNMAGASLIGIAANHNASHSLMERTKLGVNANYALTFNGHYYNSLHDILDKEGHYISRNVSGFLAAFVDNAKDHVAGDMNFNLTTADMAFTLLRLGVPTLTTGLILCQPVMKEIVDLVTNEGETIQSAITTEIKKYKQLAIAEDTDSLSGKNINLENFTDTQLAANILAAKNPTKDSKNLSEKEFNTNQLKVAYMLSKLSKVSKDLGNLTQATRADTQNGAAGPSMADDIIRIERVEDVIQEALINPDYSLEGVIGDKGEQILDFGLSEDEIVNSELPVLQAFFTYGIEGTTDLFNKFFPQYSKTYREIINVLRAETDLNNLDSKTRNNIYNDIISYCVTRFSSFRNALNGKPYTIKVKNPETNNIEEKETTARDYYINYFPEEFAKFKDSHPELGEYSLFNRLKVNKPTKYNPVLHIDFKNVGTVTDIQKEQYIRDWTALLYRGDEYREIARKLFIYNCFKGFGFTPSGFSHLASSIIKMDNKEYIQALKDLDGIFDVRNFVEQYILNHLDNRRIVPDVSKAKEFLNLKEEDLKDLQNFGVTVNKDSPKELRAFSHPFVKNEDIEFHNYIHLSINGRDLYFRRVINDQAPKTVAYYTRIKPLGIKNQYVEYSFGESTDDMESVISITPKDNGIFNPSEINDIKDEEPNERPTLNKHEFLKRFYASNGYGNKTTEANQNLEKLKEITPNVIDDFSNIKYCEGGIITIEHS